MYRMRIQGSVPSQGAKFPHASWPKKTKQEPEAVL